MFSLITINGLAKRQVAGLRFSILNLKDLIMATREEFNTKLAALADQSEKVKAEVLAALGELNNTDTTPEQDALLARIGAAVGDLDALRADTPVEPPAEQA